MTNAEKTIHINVIGTHLRNHKIVHSTLRYRVTRTVDMVGHTFFYGMRVKYDKFYGTWMAYGNEKVVCDDVQLQNWHYELEVL